MLTPVEFYLMIVLLECTLDLMIDWTNHNDGVEGEADWASPADWEYERFTIPDERQPYYFGLMESSHAP
jgi:hypothetical protein